MTKKTRQEKVRTFMSDFYEEEKKAEAEKEKKEKESYFQFDEKAAAEEAMQVPPAPRSDGLSITALVLSIVSVFCCGMATAIPALICAIIDRKKRGSFNSYSLIALIVSIISIAISLMGLILYVIAIVVAMAEMEGSGGYDPYILLPILNGRM